MPEHEFEIYLSVLSRLLKLTPEQTASIEDELRDHLEERFEELVRSGVERDDAIKQALDEFGDASGLAVNLTRVSQKPIRRWVIGSSVVSAVALLVAVTVFLTSEPDGVSLPVTSSAVAQTQPENPQPVDPQSLLLDPQPDDLELAQLSEPCSINFVEDYPLYDALDSLAKQFEVPIVIDPRLLAEGEITALQPLNVPPLGKRSDDADGKSSAHWPHQLTLAQALDVMLRDLDLTWQVRDGIITVTSFDIATDPTNLLTRSYNIEPLIRAGVSSESVIEVLQTNTGGMWEGIDGAGGQISRVGSVLMVRQTYQMQREVRQLLMKLVSPGDSPWIDYASERASLSALLKRPSSAALPLNTTLLEMLDSLSAELNVPILIDPVMLQDGVVTGDQQVHAPRPRITKVPLEAVFRLCLDEMGLVLVLQDGLPTVTSVEIASDSTELAIGVYDVHEFLQGDVDKSDFSDAVQSMTSGLWEDIDGEGGTLTLVENGLMVVTQTDDVHRSLQRLLATWQKGWADRKPIRENDQATPVTKFYHMPIETAESLKVVIPEMVAPESWKSDGNPNGGTIHAVALAQKPPQASAPEKKDDEPSAREKKNPSDGGKAAWVGKEPQVVFAQFGGGGMGGGGLGGGSSGVDDNVLEFYSQSTGVLVITQTPDVHREIDRFLASLRVSTRGRNEATANDVGKSQFGGMGGGGGFF